MPSGKETIQTAMKRKCTTLLVILLCFLIIALIVLGFFMTWLLNEQTENLEARLEKLRAEQNYSVENGTLSYMEDSSSQDKDLYTESEHHLIFVGDSRTVGMEEAVHAKDASDSCTFIGKVGEGFYWLSHSGIEQLDAVLAEEPEASVIFNLGVNDLKEINNYLDYYPQIFSDYPQASFYIMSVNPVGDSFKEISNEEIQAFNEKLQEAFPGQYLNCYNYLISENFETVDGLHYNYETYRKIHHYAVMMLSDSDK